MASICCSPPLRLPASCRRRLGELGEQRVDPVPLSARAARVAAASRRPGRGSPPRSAAQDGAALGHLHEARRARSGRRRRPRDVSPRQNGCCRRAARTRPLKARSVEVLPAPLAPIRATMLPSSTEKERPRTASMLP